MILFSNKDALDLECLRAFGLSIKPNSDSPIGYFGTGLKYAIAVLLRNNHSIEIYIDGTVHTFAVKEKTVRGEVHNFVHLNNEPHHLGFTTDLGKDWELWMAYRELYCNAKDEGGTVSEAVWPAIPRTGTAIAVYGEEFTRIHENRGKYFLQSQPIEVGPEVEIHAGRSDHIYYRGIRALKTSHQSMYTYNITKRLKLTENRTIEDASVAEGIIIHHIEQQCKLPDIIASTAKSKPRGLLEGHIAYHISYAYASKLYLKTLGALRNSDERELVSAEFFRPLDEEKQELPEESIELDEINTQHFNNALEFLIKLGFDIKKFPIIIVETFGDPLQLGQAYEGKSYISKVAFGYGAKKVAAVLYEEWLHLEHGCYDITRTMQNLLIADLISLGERVLNKPL